MTVPRRSSGAPGKLLLFGEHAAVYGYPAVGVALDRGLTVTWEPTGRWSLELETASGEPITLPASIAEFFPHLQNTLDLEPGRLTVRTDLPLSSGFGSSAALCTALARLAATRDASETTGMADAAEAAETEAALNKDVNTEVWKLAHELERFFHGTPSGIDTGLSALGGIRAFTFNRPGHLPEATPCALPILTLLVGSIPRDQDTRTLVAGIRRQREESPVQTNALLRNLGEISTTVINKGREMNASAFGAAASAAQKILKTLGVSTVVLDGILEAGTASGATGGKLSGAGGGGAFYLVCPDEQAVGPVETAVRRFLPPESCLFSLTI